MRLYDPTSSRPDRSLSRAVALSGLEGKTIGILENGKLNAVEMLHEVAALFEARHTAHRPDRFIREVPNASAPAPDGVLARAVGEVDFLITGLGD